jgi:hypothetical protein
MFDTLHCAQQSVRDGQVLNILMVILNFSVLYGLVQWKVGDGSIIDKLLVTLYGCWVVCATTVGDPTWMLGCATTVGDTAVDGGLYSPMAKELWWMELLLSVDEK